MGKAALKAYFEAGDFPTAAQHDELIENCFNREDLLKQWSGWNGGTATFNDDDNLVATVPTTGSKGIDWDGITLEVDQLYTLAINVVSKTGTWTIQEHWGSFSGTPFAYSQELELGLNLFTFVHIGGPNVIYAAVASDTIEIQHMSISPGVLPASAQVDSKQVSADLLTTYEAISIEDFVTDDAGMVNFNGGTHAHDPVGERISVSGTGGGKGVYVPAELANDPDESYIVYLDVTKGTGNIRVYSQWSTLIETITATGVYQIPFVADSSAGGFGNRIVVTTDVSDTFYINKMSIFKLNPVRINRSNDEQDDKFLPRSVSGVIHSYDFSDPRVDISDLGKFGGGAPDPVITNGQLVFEATGSGQVLCIPYGPDLVTADNIEYVDVEIDVELPTNDIVIRPMWQTEGNTFTTDGTGIYRFRLHRIGTQGDNTLNRLTINSAVSGFGASVKINRLTIFQAPSIIFEDKNVLIGRGASNTFAAAVNQQEKLGVVIGHGSTTNLDSPVIIGNLIDANHTPYYGTTGIFGAQSNDQMVVVGDSARGGGWRTSTFGAQAFAGGQSSSAFGCGAVSLSSHGQAIGRGAYVPDQALLDFVATVVSGRSMYFENSWAHKFNKPISDIDIGDHTPSTIVNEIHGQDAFDSRIPAWSNVTSYAAPVASKDADLVQHSNKIYKSIDSSTNVEPGITAGWETKWVYLHDIPSSGTGSGVPSDFDVDGGHFRCVAGRSTGSGTGGTAGLSIVDGVDLGPNIKQKVVEGLYVDSDYGAANTPVCLRKSDGTEWRLNIEVDGTIKAISRTAVGLTYPANSQQT